MVNIADKAEQVIKECCKETGGSIMEYPRKSVSFQKQFLTENSTVLSNGTKVTREFYIESNWAGLVDLIMKLENKQGAGMKLASFDAYCLTCKAIAKAMETIIESQYIVNK